MKIVLPLVKTELHLQLEVLLKRYRQRDRIYEEIQDAYGRERAGYQGEKQLDYYLHLANLKNTFSLAGLRLKWDKYYFQIDRMILTPSVCIIIESKNLKGQITLNEEDQLIQQTPDYQKSYENPYNQVKLQEKQLRHILDNLGYSNLPIHPLVVFTNKNAILNLGGKPDMIVLPQLTFRIDHLIHHYSKNQITTEIKKLAYILFKRHTKKSENVLNQYKLNPYALQTGVICKNCKQSKMARIHGTWICRHCKHQDRQAHIAALRHYATLINPFITNKEARRFLEIDSRNTIYRLFTKLNIPKIGNKKGTQYNLEKFLP